MIAEYLLLQYLFVQRMILLSMLEQSIHGQFRGFEDDVKLQIFRKNNSFLIIVNNINYNVYQLSFADRLLSGSGPPISLR